MISIVAAARNDNHGGNLLHRVQLFVNGIFRQAGKHWIPVELILVEWNSPAGPKLCNVVDWNEINPFCKVRIIEVPPYIHERTPHAGQLKLHQMLAKNAGIRRAEHEYILATNIDILFPDELFQWFNPVHLEKRVIYRTDRFDVNNKISVEDGIDEQLAYCSDHKTLHYKQRLEDRRNSLHFNACGDFQLLDKGSWMEMRGYAEFGIYPAHLDSLFQMKAFQMGIREQFIDLPACVYHVEHEMSWTPHASKAISDNMKKREIPFLTMMQSLQIAMLDPSKPINNEHWGLANLNLDETIITSSAKRAHIRTQRRSLGREDYIEACDFEDIFNKSHAKPPVAALHASHITQWLNRCNAVMQIDGTVFGKSKPEIVVFGTGSGYEEHVKPVLQLFGVSPVMFLDNNQLKQGQTLDGIPIQSASDLVHMAKGSFVVIVASSYYEEISSQLVKLGLIEGVDFINGVMSMYQLLTSAADGGE